MEMDGEDGDGTAAAPPPPPPKVVPKVFKCVIKDIKLLDNQLSTPFLRFTLGGNFKVVDNRHKYVKIPLAIALVRSLCCRMFVG